MVNHGNMGVFRIISHCTKFQGIAILFWLIGVTFSITSNIQNRVIKSEKRGGPLSKVLNRSPCCPPPRDIWQRLQSFLAVTAGGGVCHWQLTDGSQGCCYTFYNAQDSNTCVTKSCPSQNVNHAELKNASLWAKQTRKSCHTAQDVYPYRIMKAWSSCPHVIRPKSTDWYLTFNLQFMFLPVWIFCFCCQSQFFLSTPDSQVNVIRCQEIEEPFLKLTLWEMTATSAKSIINL